MPLQPAGTPAPDHEPRHYVVGALLLIPGVALWLIGYAVVGVSDARSQPLTDAGASLAAGALVGVVILWLERNLERRSYELRRIEQAASERQQTQLSLAVQADLRGLDLSRRDLQGLMLVGKNLSGASFRASDLSHAMLPRATLDEANLTKVKLTNASLVGCSFVRAILVDATLTSADLRGATLIDADAGNAIFDGASLRSARLVGASLRRASLRGADLSFADLTDADLSDANLTDAVLEGARAHNIVCSSGTKWPDDVPESLRLAGARPSAYQSKASPT